ncbi:cell cycle arrest protein [Scheffersomyces stipitis CBS 6054]|uniref:Cell cycle arrest protein n=1 Tax=Scheffersomyces stipitis (strain ATCC 58785 / CBS 6054 / NBRC 10063 / NRRL Y-11545) TaxID=322104 RepID=A3LR34_PICST|nr:cell cycle arrest protein [Scheffersomyces stipitis CBS 6054]ABN65317.2 cell cycle arrest protein [Scheffersomyces stipitis CBS 6054]KAG2734099.1 hypothetical protein G9P44_003624 [Scheffersomyces stipitis]
MPDFFELSTPSDLDIVSDFIFSPSDSNHALVSTWSNEILLYDCSAILANPDSPPRTEASVTFATDETPLCLSYAGSTGAFVGFLDGSIRPIDFENSQVDNGVNLAAPSSDDEIGNGINNFAVIPGKEKLLAASSFNGKLQVIDTRQRAPILVNQLSHDNQRRKIFTMDASDVYLTLGLNGNNIEIYDHRNLKIPVEKREVGLKYQIKDLKCFPNNEGFALSTIDGRVSVEYFDSSPQVQETKRFTFKCHRSHDKVTGADLVYPVNSIAFNKTYGTLFTAGSDGFVYLWDLEKRKRMRAYPQFLSEEDEHESIARIRLNYNDSLVGVATSDDNYNRRRRLSESNSSRQPSKVYVKVLGSTECKPKSQ